MRAGLVGAVLFVFIWKVALVGMGVLVGLILAVGLVHLQVLQHFLEQVRQREGTPSLIPSTELLSKGRSFNPGKGCE
jgi:hypothetical protein